MSKKSIILAIVILSVAAGGIFWADSIENYLKIRKMNKFLAFPEDYAVIESSTGIVVENEKDQLRIEIPKGWRVIKGTDISGTGWSRNIVLYTPDFCLSPQQGCAAEIEIYRLTGAGPAPGVGPLGFSADDIRRAIEYYNNEQETEAKDNILEAQDNSEGNSREEVIYVNQREALKWITGSKKSAIIKIPVRDKVYLFSAVLFSEKCSDEFDRFLNTISIK